jgi:hypothetical protein
MGNDRKVSDTATDRGLEAGAAATPALLPMPRRTSRGRTPAGLWRDCLTLLAILAVGVAIYFGLIAGGPAWPVYGVLVAAAPLVMLALANAGEWLHRVVTNRRVPGGEPLQQTPGDVQISNAEK